METADFSVSLNGKVNTRIESFTERDYNPLMLINAEL